MVKVQKFNKKYYTIVESALKVRGIQEYLP